MSSEFWARSAPPRRENPGYAYARARHRGKSKRQLGYCCLRCATDSENSGWWSSCGTRGERAESEPWDRRHTQAAKKNAGEYKEQAGGHLSLN